MGDSMSATILVNGITSIIKAITNKVIGANTTLQEREAISKCLVSIQKATIKTQAFIKAEGYKPNMELTELWQDALEKSINANVEEVPQYLFYKAQFWSEPNVWLDSPSSMELVPKLQYLRDQCEIILRKI